MYLVALRMEIIILLYIFFLYRNCRIYVRVDIYIGEGRRVLLPVSCTFFFSYFNLIFLFFFFFHYFYRINNNFYIAEFFFTLNDAFNFFFFFTSIPKYKFEIF